mgnify:CR=1 FL=1
MEKEVKKRSYQHYGAVHLLLSVVDQPGEMGALAVDGAEGQDLAVDLVQIPVFEHLQNYFFFLQNVKSLENEGILALAQFVVQVVSFLDSGG